MGRTCKGICFYTGTKILKSVNLFYLSLLNCVPYMLMCQHALRGYMLLCQSTLHVYVLTFLHALCAYVLTCPRVLHAYVLSAYVPCVRRCLRTSMACLLTCSRASVPCVLACSYASVSCVLLWLRAHVPTCLACFPCIRAITINDKDKFSIICFPYIFVIVFHFLFDCFPFPVK